jgi:hypothetical protein
VDFIELRRRLAQGAMWDDELFNAIHPVHAGVGGPR